MEAFLHVIYEHRYLAVAGYSWNLCGPDGRAEDKARVKRMLPQISTPILDSLLVHARSLIEFYCGAGSPSDIRLAAFTGLGRVNPTVSKLLTDRYRDAISVHAMLPTAWRDPTYRNNPTTDREKARIRPDRGKEASTLPVTIFGVLRDVSSAGTGPWARAFQRLHEASVSRLGEGTYKWPEELGDPPHVRNYLALLGL
jgi:hypothetical protein